MTVGGQYHYSDERRRQPFDPQRVRRRLEGCLLCHWRIVAVVGVFYPTNDPARQAVLTLRRNALRAGSLPGLCYGLCKRHGRAAVSGDPAILQRIEDRIIAMARKVAVQ